jgi:hypothetical protein
MLQQTSAIKSSQSFDFAKYKYDGTQPRALNEWKKYIVLKCKESKCWSVIYDKEDSYPFTCFEEIQSFNSNNLTDSNGSHNRTIRTD